MNFPTSGGQKKKGAGLSRKSRIKAGRMAKKEKGGNKYLWGGRAGG